MDTDEQTERELDAQLEERNAEIRARWVSDRSFREELKSKHLQVQAQKKVERYHNFGAWITVWTLLNSDTQKDVAQGKKDARHKMDVILAASQREKNWVTGVTSDPNELPKQKKIEIEEEESGSYGLADDF